MPESEWVRNVDGIRDSLSPIRTPMECWWNEFIGKRKNSRDESHSIEWTECPASAEKSDEKLFHSDELRCKLAPADTVPLHEWKYSTPNHGNYWFLIRQRLSTFHVLLAIVGSFGPFQSIVDACSGSIFVTWNQMDFFSLLKHCTEHTMK